jgi:hypothetical protein
MQFSTSVRTHETDNPRDVVIHSVTHTLFTYFIPLCIYFPVRSSARLYSLSLLGSCHESQCPSVVSGRGPREAAV